MSISDEDWNISVTMKSVSVPTITTSFLFVCAKGSAVETIRWHEHTCALQLCCQLLIQSGFAPTGAKESFLNCRRFHITLKQNIGR